MSHIAFMMAVFWSSLGCFVIVVIIFEVLGRKPSEAGAESSSYVAANEDKQPGGG